MSTFFSTAPPEPALGSLRVAIYDDIPRLGLVAVGGFYYSPVFRYERPQHKAYPQDTLQSYQEHFQQALRSDDQVVVVAEDNYQPKEDGKTEAVVPADNGWRPPAAGERVIVGLLSLKLAPSSKRRGRYVDEKGGSQALANLIVSEYSTNLEEESCPVCHRTKEEILIKSITMAGEGVLLQLGGSEYCQCTHSKP